MKELTILMCWHDDTDPDKQNAYAINKNSFIVNNPNYDIISIQNRFANKDKAWLSSDLNIFHWYVEFGHSVSSERFLIVEWDCWCNCNLKEYYNRVWDCDIVGPSVFYPERDYWNWFSSTSRLPPAVREYATGIVPFNGILLSQKAMLEISKQILRPEFDDFNSEMRLATIASMLNMDPVVNPECNRTNTWKEVFHRDYTRKTLYHPIKRDHIFMQIDPRLLEKSSDISKAKGMNYEAIKIKQFPIFVINLKKRKDRLISIEREFEGRDEFDVSIIEAVENHNGALGLWKSILSIFSNLQGEEPFVIICEDDHQFTTDYSPEQLERNIAEAKEKGADFLLGGVSWFTEAVQVSENLFSVETFSATQFVIVFHDFYKKIIEADFGPDDSADYKLASLSTQKFILYPFISTQKEFGYSDATTKNDNFGRVTAIFNNSIWRLDFLNRVRMSLRKNLNSENLTTRVSAPIPAYVINLSEDHQGMSNIVNQFKARPEFDATIIEIKSLDINKYGIGRFLQKIVQLAKENKDDVIIICDSSHQFSSSYSKESLLTNIYNAQKAGVKLIVGGTEQFGTVVPLSENIYWTDWFKNTQFIILTKFLYEEILSMSGIAIMSLSMIYNQSTSNKVILYPFISQKIADTFTTDTLQQPSNKDLEASAESMKKLIFMQSEFKRYCSPNPIDP